MIWQFGIAGGIGLFVIIAVILGWLIPRASHLRELAAERRRGDDWKEVAEERATLITKQSGQITELLEVSKFIEHVFRAAGPEETTGPGGA